MLSPPEPSVSWTDDRFERLKSLLEGKLTASQIAAELGGVTRSAVIGKVNRSGLKFQGAHINAARKKRIRSKRAQCNGGAAIAGIKAVLKWKIEFPADELTTLPLEQIARPPVALPDLEPEHCRWPISDEANNTIGFCGAPRIDDTFPYCACHCRIAYRRYRNISEAERERRRWLGKYQVASGAWSCGFATRGEVNGL